MLKFSVLVFLLAGSLYTAATNVPTYSVNQKVILSWLKTLSHENFEQVTVIANKGGTTDQKLTKFEKLSETDASKKSFFVAKPALLNKMTEAYKVEQSLSDPAKKGLASYRISVLSELAAFADASDTEIKKIRAVVHPFDPTFNGEYVLLKAKLAAYAATKTP